MLNSVTNRCKTATFVLASYIPARILHKHLLTVFRKTYIRNANFNRSQCAVGEILEYPSFIRINMHLTLNLFVLGVCQRKPPCKCHTSTQIDKALTSGCLPNTSRKKRANFSGSEAVAFSSLCRVPSRSESLCLQALRLFLIHFLAILEILPMYSVNCS